MRQRKTLLVSQAIGPATIVALVMLGAADASAQTPSSPTEVAFEVASVKENLSGEDGGRIRPEPPRRFSVINLPLRALIGWAYDVQAFRMVGLPGWATSMHYDIVATTATDFPPAVAGQPGPWAVAMRRLLADRFQLAVHRETRDMDVYALVHARTDRRIGPQLKPSTKDCSPAAVAARRANPAVDEEREVCGWGFSLGRLQFGGYPMSQFASVISPQDNRLVVDRTGLTGNWELELQYGPPGNTDRPPLVTALREQLGLKLEPARAAVEVLVIDFVERPTPD